MTNTQLYSVPQSLMKLKMTMKKTFLLMMLMTKTMWKNEKMENTMCSSSDDVDDEDYVKKWKTQCVLPLMMLMTKTM